MESRHLLSSLSEIVAQPSVEADWGNRGGGGSSGTTTITSPISGSLTPSQVRQAYGFNQITFNTGKSTITGDGTGETIAIVDAYNDPNIAKDLATFDAQYGLPTANLTVVNQSGSTTSLPSTDAGWALEISLDVEWAHAMAPGAKILLVEANSSSLSDLLTAAKYASTKANVVSMSWGSNEFSSETSYDSTFNVSGVTFVASSGDSGGISGAEWPAASPNVVSVGGTTLYTTSTGTYEGETAWSGYSSQGSGGGLSQYESTPSYQQSAFPNQLPARTTPDVSYNANPNTGYAVYDSLAYSGQSGWFEVGGTSAGAPQWAALVAIADQGRAISNLSALSSQNTLSLLYNKASTEYQSTASAYFNDITSGSNAYYYATRGYDLVTGLGSPKAATLVSYLAGSTSTTSTTTTTTTTGSSSGSGTTTGGHSHNSPPPAGPRQFSSTTQSTVVVAVASTTATVTQATPIIVAPPASSSTSTSTSTTSTASNVTSSTTSTTTATSTTTSLPRGQSVDTPRWDLFRRSINSERPLSKALSSRLNTRRDSSAPAKDKQDADQAQGNGQAVNPVLENVPGAEKAREKDVQPAPPAAPVEPGAPSTPDETNESPDMARPAISISIVFGLWKIWERRKEKPEKKRRRIRTLWQ